MADGKAPEAAPVRIWADWDQLDGHRRVWTLAEDCPHPERLHAGVLVLAGPDFDVRPARVVSIVVERWRTVVLLAPVGAEHGSASPGR